MAKTRVSDDICSSEEYQRYRELLKINREDLEGCLEDQPMFFEEVSFRAVTANKMRDQAKLRLEEAIAKLDRDIREEAAEDGVKITESAIANKIKLNNSIQLLQQEFLNCKETADLWAGMLQSFTQRSYSLKDIVSIAIRQMTVDSDIIASERDKQSMIAAKSDRVSKEAGKMRRAKLKSR